MKVEHGNKVCPRRGEAVTCRTVWQPPAPVLAWVVTAKQDLDAVGLCIDGFWGFLSTEGSQKFWTSFNLWGESWRKWGWHQSSGGCCRDHLDTAPGLSWEPPYEPIVLTHVSSGHHHSPNGSSFTLQFTIYNGPGCGPSRLMIVCSKLNILWLRQGQSPVHAHRVDKASALKDSAV